MLFSMLTIVKLTVSGLQVALVRSWVPISAGVGLLALPNWRTRQAQA